ncbi:hypothetical protein FOA52_003179 [Chlamydomonas sp. UWO 241]|nr:hypothetical protein FOA52_003179 [Chlamydomonas sp. UWO 241]
MTLSAEVVQQAAAMMATMSPAEVAEVSRTGNVPAGIAGVPTPPGIGSFPGMPAGGYTPEMAKTAAEMMSRMSPEQMADMSDKAAAMGLPGMPKVGD